MSSYALVLAMVLSACVEPQLVECSDGRLCSRDQQCDTVHHLCVADNQLSACMALADGVSCNVDGIVGSCDAGVCLLSICGDGFVGPAEQCDDGNRTSRDGCNATCTSDERCGNGIVDLGEDCDDGDRISGDGCDSLCSSENETWTIEGVFPLYHTSGHTTYDELRRQAVHVEDGLTWTWDGTKWSLLSTTGLPTTGWSWWQVVYDVADANVLVIAADANFVVQVWTWSGTSWSHVAVTGTVPTIGPSHVVYDRARHVVLMEGNIGFTESLWAFDPATAKWSAKPAGASMNVASQFAYDEARDLAVLVIGGTQTREWNGTAWSAVVAQGPPSPSNFVVMYDPHVGAVIALGNGTAVAKWTGTLWTTLAETSPLDKLPDVWFDRARQRRVALNQFNTTYEYDGTAWVGPSVNVPTDSGGFGEQRFAYDTKRGQLVRFGRSLQSTSDELWSYDGQWHRLPDFPPPNQFYLYAIVYDPIRDAFVVNLGDKSTWLFREGAWSTFESPGTSAIDGAAVAVFDPSRQAIIAANPFGTFELPSTGDHWTKLVQNPLLQFPASIAYDARANQLALDARYGGTFVFDGTAWTSTLSSGPQFALAADARHGTIELLGAHSAFERVDGVWFERATMPLAIDGAAIYAPDRGELLVVGDFGYSHLIAKRRFVGPRPVDACLGNDDDGDGLVDCADPECWWSCTPACPPHASCL